MKPKIVFQQLENKIPIELKKKHLDISEKNSTIECYKHGREFAIFITKIGFACIACCKKIINKRRSK